MTLATKRVTSLVMTRDGRKIERRITRNDAVGADDRNPRIGAGAQTIGNEMRPTETDGRI
jgi:hypothetical protein